MFENFYIENIQTPVDVDKYEQLLIETKYDPTKTEALVNGFREGFSLEYDGQKENIRRMSNNLPLRVGSELELWNKVMKEVKNKRFAGPYLEKDIPFKNFIQSPIGLVEKDGGKDTRLIFHLSYPKDGNSVNYGTPQELCKVEYPSFEDAVVMCLKKIKELNQVKDTKGIHLAETISTAKSDMGSAFRNLGMKIQDFPWLMMKAKNPLDGLWYFFIDKCLPFGASVSCKKFQDFSDSVAHIFRVKSNEDTLNYLDDFFFAALTKMLCDGQVALFLEICNTIKFPISMEKTVWGSSIITFLGLLIDSIHRVVSIPEDKIRKAKRLIRIVLDKKKVTLLTLQQLCGYLNFLCKAIVPGRVFTRRLYAFTSSKEKLLKEHHHIWVNAEMRSDISMWLKFLETPLAYARPFLDYDEDTIPEDINFYTDATKNENLGGGICDNYMWMMGKWDKKWILDTDPSIEYLELYAVVAGVMVWCNEKRMNNKRLLLHCDNESVCFMINTNSSKCKNCMHLLKLLILEGLKNNLRFVAEHVKGTDNFFADFLSRQQVDAFFKRAKKEGMDFRKRTPCTTDKIWPISKIWK